MDSKHLRRCDGRRSPAADGSDAALSRPDKPKHDLSCDLPRRSRAARPYDAQSSTQVSPSSSLCNWQPPAALAGAAFSPSFTPCQYNRSCMLLAHLHQQRSCRDTFGRGKSASRLHHQLSRSNRASLLRQADRSRRSHLTHKYESVPCDRIRRLQRGSARSVSGRRVSENT